MNWRERHTNLPTKVQEAEHICKASHSGERLFGMISRCDSECEHLSSSFNYIGVLHKDSLGHSFAFISIKCVSDDYTGCYRFTSTTTTSTTSTTTTMITTDVFTDEKKSGGRVVDVHDYDDVFESSISN